MTYKLPDGKSILSVQERIELGQAKNQATIILAQVWVKIIPSEREELYKKAVKQLYRWNRELDAEIMAGERQNTEPQKNQPSINLPPGSRYPEHEKGKYGERR